MYSSVIPRNTRFDVYFNFLISEFTSSSIAWDLALARKWRECMAIEKFDTGGNPEQGEMCTICLEFWTNNGQSGFTFDLRSRKYEL